MIGNYLKIALRTLSKNKLVSFINLFGLGLSMSVGMMIMIRLQDQLSYDNFHPHPKQTYRIISQYEKKDGEQWKMASTPLPIRDQLSKDADIVAAATTIYPALRGKSIANSKELYLNAAFTDPSFFNVFGFQLSAGNQGNALALPNSIVITEEIAEKFFGKKDPLGEWITVEGKGEYLITGVLETPPSKSHIHYDALASLSSVAALEKNKQLPERTMDAFAFNAGYTYVSLKKKSDRLQLEEDLAYISRELNTTNKEGTTSFEIQRLDKITPGTERLSNDIGGGSSWSKLLFEIGMALLILLAACFNYTNLSIARALTRAKEVGVRKIVGATRLQIFIQYIIEALLIALAALGFAWLILSFIIRYAPFNDGYEFIPSTTNYNASLVIWSIAFALFTGLLAGAAPAWILSSFKALRVLKNLNTAKIFGKISLQKSLIVFQYSLSLIIIIFLTAFYRQFNYMSSLDPGFKKEHVLVIATHDVEPGIASQKLQQVNGVKKVAAFSMQFSKHFNGLKMPMWTSDVTDAKAINYCYADEQLIPTMELSMIAGENFRAGQQEKYVLLNEQAVAALGIENASAAIGRKIWISDSTQIEVSGVVKDFNYENMARPIAPLVFKYNPAACSYLYVTTEPIDKSALQKRVAGVWDKLPGTSSIDYSWLDDDIEQSYSQSATISLLGYLAFIAVSIATLGLLGLVIYSIEVKRKEISIRKIIGASIQQLISMLSKKFVRLLIIAGLIAMPIGYTAGVFFLQNFPQRTSFGLVSVGLCFLVLLIIGMATIISQTYRASIENPVINLRNE